MATLNRAEQGTHPASTPNSPRHKVMGEGEQTGTLLFAPAPQWSNWPGQNTFACSSSAASRVATVSQSRGVPKLQQVPRQNAMDSSALQCYRCQAGVIWLGSVQLTKAL